MRLDKHYKQATVGCRCVLRIEECGKGLEVWTFSQSALDNDRCWLKTSSVIFVENYIAFIALDWSFLPNLKTKWITVCCGDP